MITGKAVQKWTSGHQNPSLKLWQIPHEKGSRQTWWDRDGMCTRRPQSTCWLRLVAALLLTPSGFFWSVTTRMNCKSYEVTVQVVGAWVRCVLGFLSNSAHPYSENLSMMPWLTAQDCKSVWVILKSVRGFPSSPIRVWVFFSLSSG